MEYISVSQYAAKYGISERTARNYCTAGKIQGAFLTGKTWNIPEDAVLPQKGKSKLSPLLARLREEKEETKKELPQKIGFEESGVKGYLHLRYD